MEEHQLQAVQRTARATKESIGLQTKRQVALSLSLQVSLSRSLLLVLPLLKVSLCL